MQFHYLLCVLNSLFKALKHHQMQNKLHMLQNKLAEEGYRAIVQEKIRVKHHLTLEAKVSVRLHLMREATWICMIQMSTNKSNFLKSHSLLSNMIGRTSKDKRQKA